MINNYNTFEGVKVSKISANRPHFTFRPMVNAVSMYPYVINYGDNFHSLSQAVFNTDTNWWILQDINKLRDSFSLKIGDVINLPEELVKSNVGSKFFF